MSSYHKQFKQTSDFHRQLNHDMVKYVPELDSHWSHAPMAFDRWRRPEETVDNGDPCFIACKQDNGIKPDYVYFADGIDGPGYYHLRTQQAFIAAFWKCKNEGPNPFDRFSLDRKKRQEHKRFLEVKQFLLQRSLAEEPDDILAARLRLAYETAEGSAMKAAGRATFLPTITTALLLGVGF